MADSGIKALTSSPPANVRLMLSVAGDQEVMITNPWVLLSC